MPRWLYATGLAAGWIAVGCGIVLMTAGAMLGGLR